MEGNGWLSNLKQHIVFTKMIHGIVIGIVGIVVLLMLIPLLKGLHD